MRPHPDLWLARASPLNRICVLTDFDGTLVEFVDDPAAVTVPGELPSLLTGLDRHLDGATAIISGRPLSDLVSFLPGYGGVAIGSHGSEWRNSSGQFELRVHEAPLSEAFIARLAGLRERFPFKSIEEKQLCVTIHHRFDDHLAGQFKDAVAAMMTGLDNWQLFSGYRVLEIRPLSSGKGRAARDLLAGAAFADKLPVCLGDDLADIDLFDAVEEMGGITIAVGSRIQPHARFALSSPAAARLWLHQLLSQLHWQRK